MMSEEKIWLIFSDIFDERTVRFPFAFPSKTLLISISFLFLPEGGSNKVI